MRLTELLNTENVTISCELFPPKQGAQLDNYKKIVGDMAALKPAYMSVTYGATGGTSDYTVELANEVRNVNHIPALAHEFGIEITGDTFDRLHRGAHYLLDVRPAGRWPAETFYYAGGVPAIMEEIKEHLHLDVMTVTGKTLGENLEDLKKNGFYERCEKWLAQFILPVALAGSLFGRPCFDCRRVFLLPTKLP